MLSAELWNKGEQFWVWGSIRTSTEPDWWAELCDLSHPSQGLDWCPLTKVVPLNDVTKTTGTWHYCLLSAITVLSTGISIVLLIHCDSRKAGVIAPFYRWEKQSTKQTAQDPNAKLEGGRAGIQGRWVQPGAPGARVLLHYSIDVPVPCPQGGLSAKRTKVSLRQSFWVTFKKVCKFYDPEQSHVNFSLKI